MNSRDLRARIERLESSGSAGSRARNHAAVINAVLLDTDDPREIRAALLAIPPCEFRDHFLDQMNENGEWLPDKSLPPEWVRPESEDDDDPE